MTNTTDAYHDYTNMSIDIPNTEFHGTVFSGSCADTRRWTNMTNTTDAYHDYTNMSTEAVYETLATKKIAKNIK
jgi:hypothetical protein